MDLIDFEAVEANPSSESDDENFDPQREEELLSDLFDDEDTRLPDSNDKGKEKEKGGDDEWRHREEVNANERDRPRNFEAMDIEQLSQSILGEEEEEDETSNELRQKLSELQQLVQQRQLRRSATEQPLRRLRRRNDDLWNPPPIELSPELSRTLTPEEQEDLKASLNPFYKEKERELKVLREENRHNRPWKEDPLRQKLSTAPYRKSDPVSWVRHRFIAPGWDKFKGLKGEPDRVWNPYQFDEELAEFQFRALWLPENERPLALRKQFLVEYMNHFVAHVIGRGKTYFVIRQSDSSGKKPVCLDRKTDQKDMMIYFSRKVVCREPNEAEEGKPAKPIEIGKIWLESPHRLRFHCEVFDPQTYHRKLQKHPSYNPSHDEELNTYLGWAVDKSAAAKYHHQLYRRLIRPIHDLYEKQYFDRRPLAGWFHPIFVDRSNISFFKDLFDDVAIGSIITQYHALPNSPYARGPAWMHNPHWEEDHLPLQLKLRNYNMNYYFTVPPKSLADNVMSTNNADREQEIFNMWFNNPHQPYHDAGPSCAPILQWIWEALCAGEKEDLYLYLLNWLAFWRKNLEPGGNTTALVLRSNPGTGKTSFVKMLGTLVGESYFLETNDCTDITGYFTTSLEQKLLLFLDEFKVAGPDAMRKLKSIITGTHIRQRQMQSNATNVKKWFSTVICANKWMVLNADPGERRFVFIELPDQLCGTKNYLTALSRSLFTRKGKFEFGGDKKYNQNNPGAGVFLLAHYLDTWEIHKSVSILQIPQNALLYLHQVASLESVASWWFEKLARGTLVESAAMDDWQVPEIRRQRNFLQINVSQYADKFLNEFQNQLMPDNNQGTQPIFSDTWIAKHSTGGRLDWLLVCLSLTKPLVYGPRSKLYGLISGSPIAQQQRLYIFKALLSGRPVEVTPTAPFRKTRKFYRASYFARLLQYSDDWQRYIWKQQLYNLYLEETGHRSRVDVKSFKAFFDELKELSLVKTPSPHACVMNFNDRHGVSAGLAVDRSQLNRIALPNNVIHNRDRNPDLDAVPYQQAIRVYIQLDTLHNHRRAFWEFMRWDIKHWEEVWHADRRPRNDQKRPWHLFGDKIFY